MKTVTLPKLEHASSQKLIDFYEKACEIDECKRLRVSGLE